MDEAQEHEDKRRRSDAIGGRIQKAAMPTVPQAGTLGSVTPHDATNNDAPSADENGHEENEDTSSSGSSNLDVADETSSDASEDEIDNQHENLDPSPETLAAAGPPSSNKDIHTRLTSFFSQLAQQRANPDPRLGETIEEDSSDSGYEDDEDGKQYVELDLALGVLEESAAQSAGDNVKLPSRPDDGGSGSDSDYDQGSQEASADVLQNLQAITDHGATKKTKQKPKKRKVEEIS